MKLKQLTIIADENIPGVEDLFSSIGRVTTVNGRQLTREQLIDVDVLLVRSVTQVDASLLAGTKVRFVGTATIGTDHLDIPYLEANNIAWASAPGSNANSVVDYMFSCFSRLDGVLDMVMAGATVGIIGMGNVGSRLYSRLSALGASCKGYDPLIEQDRYPVLTTLEDVLEADIICCHAALTVEGEYPSYHLFDKKRIENLAPSTILINAGRGPVIDNDALLDVLPERRDLCVVLDVWENEPAVSVELMKKVDFGSPHIAGYSVDGKRAGAAMVYQACCETLGIECKSASSASDDLLPLRITEPSDVVAAIREAVLKCYDVAKDDQRFRGAMLRAEESQRSIEFDRLRKTYPARREFSCYKISNTDELDQNVVSGLNALGFRV